MAEAVKLANELLPALNDVFGEELQKHASISTNLPCDSLGFWLTQGVPLGIFLLHLIMVLMGERDIGRCFVTGNVHDLTVSQERFLTEFCLDQAIHSGCFNSTLSSEPTECTGLACDVDQRRFVPESKIHPAPRFDTLFIYRYHLWFLFIFVVIRALPQLLWRVFSKADVRKAVKGIATLAEFQHATCVIMTLKRATTSFLGQNDGLAEWTGDMNKMVIREVTKRAQGKWLFRKYVLRKLMEIALDAGVIALIGVVFCLKNRTPFDHLAFVCNIQREPANGLLCKAIKDQYIACTVSFGVEFIISVWLLGIVLSIDLLVQIIFLLWFTRVGHKMVRFLTGDCIFSGAIEYWDDSMTQDLELERNEHWGKDELHKSFMKTPNDLYLIGLMYRQSDVSHGQFLKMMAEKMVKDLHPNFISVNRSQVVHSESIPTERNLTEDMMRYLSIQSARQARESFVASGDGLNSERQEVQDTQPLL